MFIFSILSIICEKVTDNGRIAGPVMSRRLDYKFEKVGNDYVYASEWVTEMVDPYHGDDQSADEPHLIVTNGETEIEMAFPAPNKYGATIVKMRAGDTLTYNYGEFTLPFTYNPHEGEFGITIEEVDFDSKQNWVLQRFAMQYLRPKGTLGMDEQTLIFQLDPNNPNNGRYIIKGRFLPTHRFWQNLLENNPSQGTTETSID